MGLANQLTQVVGDLRGAADQLTVVAKEAVRNFRLTRLGGKEREQPPASLLPQCLRQRAAHGQQLRVPRRHVGD